MSSGSHVESAIFAITDTTLRFTMDASSRKVTDSGCLATCAVHTADYRYVRTISVIRVVLLELGFPRSLTLLGLGLQPSKQSTYCAKSWCSDS